MSFYTHLDLLGSRDVLRLPKISYPKFIKMERIVEVLHKVIEERGKIVILRDYDADGLYGGEVVEESLIYLKYTNYYVVPYTKRTHDIDSNGIKTAYNMDADLVIIIDTGSSELQYVNTIKSMVKNLIIIDHHESIYDYEDYSGIDIINTTMERKAGNEFYRLSAAALTYLVFRSLFEKLMVEVPSSLSVLALCSMYSDSIDMSSEVARMIYKEASQVGKGSVPRIVSRFMRENTTLNRRFIEFSINPPLNSLFRSESFEILNSLLSWKPSLTSVPLSSIMDSMTSTYEYYRNEVYTISDMIEVRDIGEFVVGDLKSASLYTTIDSKDLHNYTGLVANNLSGRYQKPAIVYGDSQLDIKCSLRDLRSRNFLSLFQRFSKANGHNSAFAISVPYRKLNDFLQYVALIGPDDISGETNEPIILDYTIEEPTEDLVRDMAFYNEFAGNLIPYFMISKVWNTPMKRSGYKSYYKQYKWDQLTIRSRTTISPYSKVIMKPYRSRLRNGVWLPELFVERIIG